MYSRSAISGFPPHIYKNVHTTQRVFLQVSSHLGLNTKCAVLSTRSLKMFPCTHFQNYISRVRRNLLWKAAFLCSKWMSQDDDPTVRLVCACACRERICFLSACRRSHPVSRFEDLFVLSAKLVEESVCQLHAAAPQFPWRTEGRAGRGLGGAVRWTVMCPLVYIQRSSSHQQEEQCWEDSL